MKWVIFSFPHISCMWIISNTPEHSSEYTRGLISLYITVSVLKIIGQLYCLGGKQLNKWVCRSDYYRKINWLDAMFQTSIILGQVFKHMCNVDVAIHTWEYFLFCQQMSPLYQTLNSSICFSTEVKSMMIKEPLKVILVEIWCWHLKTNSYR